MLFLSLGAFWLLFPGLLRLSGTGEPVFKGEVHGGVRRDEAVALLKGFYDQENPFAPAPKVKGVRVEKTKYLESKR